MPVLLEVLIGDLVVVSHHLGPSCPCSESANVSRDACCTA
jgi:hypothetical protein